VEGGYWRAVGAAMRRRWCYGDTGEHCHQLL